MARPRRFAESRFAALARRGFSLPSWNTCAPLRCAAPSLRRAWNGWPRSAFTVLELLVSISILALLVVLLSALQNTVAATHLAAKQIEGSESIRMALDRLEVDISSMCRVGGTPLALAPFPPASPRGNSCFAFITPGRPANPAPATPLRFQAVAFSLGTNPTLTSAGGLQNYPALLRARFNVPLSETEPNSVLKVAVSDAAESIWKPPPAGAAVLGDDVFRMEVVFVLSDGEIVPQDSSRLLPAPLFPPPASARLDNVKALIVGLVALDLQDRLLIGPVNASRLAQSFPAVTATNQTPLDIWNIASAPVELPRTSLAGLQFGQRTYLLR